MSKLVDKERLAKLAQALDARAKAAVQAEKERAMAVEKANADEMTKQKDAAQEGTLASKIADNAAAIEVLNGDENKTGSVAKAVKDAVDDLASRHDEEMDAVEGRVGALEAKFEGDQSVDAKIQAAQKAAETEAARLDGVLKTELQAEIDADVKVEKERAEGQEAAIRQELADEAAEIRGEMAEQHQAMNQAAADETARVNKKIADDIAAESALRVAEEKRIVGLVEAEAQTARAAEAANKAVLDKLDGAVDVEGSVKKQIKDAIDVVNQAANGLGDRVEALETFKNTTYPAAEAKVREDFAAADAQVLADAKKHANEEITKLVDSAPDAMNTLNELASAISANKGVYDAYVEQHAAAMTKMKEDLQKEIDDDVKVVADELAKQKDAAQNGTLAHQIAAEKSRAEGVEAGFKTRIEANEAFVTAQPDIDKAQDDRLAALEALHEGENSVENQIAKALQDAKEYADDQDAIVQGEVDALEAVVGKEAEGENAATGIFAKMAAMQADIDQNEADCNAAVKAENERAVAEEGKIRGEFANADVALHNTIKAEMAAVIQSLVAEITEDGMLRIALGGVEGDEVLVIKEQEIPFVTDAEIDAIIAGLDAPAGE